MKAHTGPQEAVAMRLSNTQTSINPGNIKINTTLHPQLCISELATIVIKYTINHRGKNKPEFCSSGFVPSDSANQLWICSNCSCIQLLGNQYRENRKFTTAIPCISFKFKYSVRSCISFFNHGTAFWFYHQIYQQLCYTQQPITWEHKQSLWRNLWCSKNKT